VAEREERHRDELDVRDGERDADIRGRSVQQKPHVSIMLSARQRLVGTGVVGWATCIRML
jgi:hypothetical protein